MRRSKKLTLSSALTALIVVILYLGSLVEILDLVILFTSCLFIAFSVIELDGGWKWMIFFGSAILAIVFIPNKFLGCEYILVGILTILKSYYEKLPRLPQWIAKLVSFNVLYAGMLALFFLLFNLPFVLVIFSFPIPTYVLPVAFALVGNLLYLLYDLLLTRMIALYYTKYSDRIHRWINQ